jgi:hypothetical protein
MNLIEERMTDAEWEKVFNNPAILEVICETPPNTAKYHDEDEDDCILDNLRRQAPWLRRIMRLSMDSINKGE